MGIYKISSKSFSRQDGQPWVPVVSSTGRTLMPCSPKRARKLMDRGRAIPSWKKDLFYIKLLDREVGEIQEVSIGIDPGSKMEGYTISSSKKTYLNIQSHAINGSNIKNKIVNRARARHFRTYRKKPYRKPRFSNRTSKDYLPPSTKARWQLKLNIVNWLTSLYPIKYCIVEDVKVSYRKGSKKWNLSFSPVQVGKDYFYRELERTFGPYFVHKPGYYTSELRREFGLTKDMNKKKVHFNTHCVDSWVLSKVPFLINDVKLPCMKVVLELIPRKLIRRQLHKHKFIKGNRRPRRGGTLTHGVKKGTLCTHPKYGFVRLGGSVGGRVSLHEPFSNSRICHNGKLEDLILHSYSPWSIRR